MARTWPWDDQAAATIGEQMSDPGWYEARQPRGRAQRAPSRPLPAWDDEPARSRPAWGELPGVFGLGVMLAGTASGALITVAAHAEPGVVLCLFLVVSTVLAVLAVRPRRAYLIIPVPALAYLAAALAAGIAVNQTGSSLTALSAGAAQWIASGFVAMVAATALAILITAFRWPRHRGDRDYVPRARRAAAAQAAGPDGEDLADAAPVSWERRGDGWRNDGWRA